MDIREVVTLAMGLMIDHGLRTSGNQWDFKLDRAVRRAGYADQYDKVISLSKPLMELYDEKDVRNTILHEIAHALTHPDAKAHGKVWRSHALRIGCDGKRCVRADAPKPKGNWIGKCPGCSHLYTMYRSPRRVKICDKCGNKYAQYVIDWTYKGMKVVMSDAYRREFADIRYKPYFRFSAETFDFGPNSHLHRV
jgi:predicted SprT family Zn-dependent metalloprotease